MVRACGFLQALLVLLGLGAGPAAWAQDRAAGRPAPAAAGEGPPDAGAGSARPAERPLLLLWKRGRDQVAVDEPASAPAAAAQRLAVDYLDYWSAPNMLTLDATPHFYAPKVRFHGRLMDAPALAREKRRFTQRWPYRNYVPRAGTMRTTCTASGQACTVRTTFDYTAASPTRRSQVEGRAVLELGMRFVGGRPVIASETSRVVRRDGVRRIAGSASSKRGE